MAMSYPPTGGYGLRDSPDELQLENLKPWLRVIDPLPKDTGGYLPFTIEFYLYVRSVPAAADYWGVLGSNQEGANATSSGVVFALHYASDQQYRFYLDGTVVLAGNISIDTWVHVALVYDGSNIHLYEDAVSLGSKAKSGTDDPPSSVFHSLIGASSPADALLANLRFWDHARSQAQIADDMNTGYDASETGLLAAYRLDSGLFLEPAEVGADEAILLNHATFTLDADIATTLLPPPYKGLNNGLLLLGGISDSDQQQDYPGQISGVVTVKGDPASQRVMALERSTGKKVAETTSAEDGTYTLTGLDPDVAHVIVALDKNLEYNGVIADNITPEVPA